MEQIIILEVKQFQEIRDDIKAIKKALEFQGKISLPKKWITTNQVAELLGISKRTVYHYVAKGILMPHKIGGTQLFEYDNIESMLNKSK
jgi:excisionase family DNA binding protein